MKAYIPVTLDVDRLIEKRPPVEINKFSKDKLLYIIHSVAYLQTYRDDLKSGGDYVPVNSTYLHSIAGIRNYNQYLEYLVDTGVFSTIPSFVVGKSSRVYKFTPRYTCENKAVELKDKRFVKSLERDTRKEEAISQYKNLWQWFSRGNLRIDRERALEYLNKVYPLFGSEEYQALVMQDDWFHEDFTLKHYRTRRMIENIHAGDPENFHFTVDTTAGRLHTILTNMKKEFRNFLTYGGRPLASCDVKCCQPYLSLLLLRPEFYQLGSRGKAAAGALNVNSSLSGVKSLDGNMLSMCHISFYDNHSDNILLTSMSLSDTIILVKQIAEDPENALYSDVERYKHDILVKDFYTELRDGFNKEYGLDSTRNDMKGLWSAVAFGKVKHMNNRYTSDFHRYFAKRYPTILKLYDSLKADKHQNMAHLLQRIEAHIVLKVASKRITKQKPRVPLYSIHDSLISTVEHIGFVGSVMENELQKLVGEKPKLEVEYWSPNALIEHAKAG